MLTGMLPEAETNKKELLHRVICSPLKRQFIISIVYHEGSISFPADTNRPLPKEIFCRE
jgi:hypothetical protein